MKKKQQRIRKFSIFVEERQVPAYSNLSTQNNKTKTTQRNQQIKTTQQKQRNNNQNENHKSNYQL